MAPAFKKLTDANSACWKRRIYNVRGHEIPRSAYLSVPEKSQDVLYLLSQFMNIVFYATLACQYTASLVINSTDILLNHLEQ